MEQHLRILASFCLILSFSSLPKPKTDPSLKTSETTVVFLEDIDSGLTSPTGNYRWLDIADQPYSPGYQASYNYTQADARVEFKSIDTSLHGSLIASNLKPNFAYQLKLSGIQGTPANERIGLTGRWWQEEWNGSKWVNGQNLNNKGDGSFPNPNDNLYFQRRDVSDSSSPTGLHYRYTGYLVFDYIISNDVGDVFLDFESDSSYHVLWKTSQRIRSTDDGPLLSATFDADNSPAYEDSGEDDFPTQNINIFGEWERLPVGSVNLPIGDYITQIYMTEESFHGSGGELSGNWAAAMGAKLKFCTIDDSSTPVGSIIINDGEAYTNSLSVNLSLSTCSEDSEVSLMRLSNDESSWNEWESYITEKTWGLNNGNGIKTVYIQYKDTTGDISSTYSDTITLDTEAPVVTVRSPDTTNEFFFTVSWPGVDSLSGIDVYDVQYKVGENGAWMPWLTETKQNSGIFGPLSPVGVQRGEIYYFRAQARDNAGNLGTFPGGHGASSTYVEPDHIFLPLLDRN